MKEMFIIRPPLALCWLMFSYHRYLVVCNAKGIMGREKQIGNQILKISLCTPLGIGMLSSIYRENTFYFLFCMGKMEIFYLDLKHPFSPLIGGAAIKLPFFNPFRLSANMVSFAFVFVVPLLYYKIFKFRQKQDNSVKGIKESRS